jgi:hypothetical protein
MAEIDIVPTQARDFAAPCKSKMPRVPITIVGDTAQNGADLVGGKVSNFLALPGTRSTSPATFLDKRPSATSCASTWERAPSM